MIPESHPTAFDVDVCEMESVFVHVTVAPTAMERSSGTKARFPSTCAPIGIMTVDAGSPGVAAGVGDGPGVGAGVGDGSVDGDEGLLPQAIAPIKMAVARTRRIEIMWVLRSV